MCHTNVNKIGFKARINTGDKEKEFIMIKRPLGKEGTIIPNFYAPSDTVSKHEKLIELKGELDNTQSWLAILIACLTNRKKQQ